MVGNLNTPTATMWTSLAFLILVVLHNVVCSEESSKAAMKAPMAKYAGRGYGYDNYGGGGGGGDRGYSRNNGYGQGHGHSGGHGGGGGGGGGYGHSRGHEERHVPISIPYIDRNGCRFPGDVVCEPETNPAGYNYCVLSDESKNLWKKPSMEVVVVACVGTLVLSDFCNDNERILKAAGLIKDKNPHNFYYHQQKYAVQLNPCILIAPPEEEE